MKAELCCAGLSTAAASRASSCLSSLSHIRRFSMFAAASVRGFVKCQCGSKAPKKVLHSDLHRFNLGLPREAKALVGQRQALSKDSIPSVLPMKVQ